MKTDSGGRIITGPNSDPVKNLVEAEAAGERGGLLRFTKILFGAGYKDGCPDAGTRIDPNNPQVSSGNSTVSTDDQCTVAASFLGGPPIILPTEVPITFAGGLTPGDGKGPILVSLDTPFVTMPDGSLQIDRLGTSNLAPLIVGGQINPALAADHIAVLRDTHGKTSHLSAADLEALSAYLRSLE